MDTESDVVYEMDFLKHDSIGNKVAALIRNGIIEGKFKPGEHLIESRLAKQFGISRSPLREAFRLLKKEGFITLVPRKGVWVSSITKEDIDNIYHVRSTLDALAVKLSVPHFNKQDIDELEQIIRRMGKCVEEKTIPEYGRLNAEFHEMFYRKSRNKWLVNINESLVSHANRMRVHSLSVKERLEESHTEHVEIFEAIRNEKYDEAEEIMKRHMDTARIFVLKKIEDEKGKYNEEVTDAEDKDRVARHQVR